MAMNEVSPAFQSLFQLSSFPERFGEEIDPRVTWEWPISPCPDFNRILSDFAPPRDALARAIVLDHVTYLLVPLRLCEGRLNLPPYPGLTLPGSNGISVGGHRCLDGTLGRQDPRFVPQLYRAQTPWMGYHANPDDIDVALLPEYRNLMLAWIPDAPEISFDIGSWDSNFCVALWDRKDVLEKKLSRQLAHNLHARGWLGNTVRPPRIIWTMEEAEASSNYMASKDAMGLFQRYVAELQAISEWLEDSLSIQPESPVSVAAGQSTLHRFQGVWLVPEMSLVEAQYLARGRIPIYALIRPQNPQPAKVIADYYGFDNGEGHRLTIHKWASKRWPNTWNANSQLPRSRGVPYPRQPSARAGSHRPEFTPHFRRGGWRYQPGHPRHEHPSDSAFNLWTIPSWLEDVAPGVDERPTGYHPGAGPTPLLPPLGLGSSARDSLGTRGRSGGPSAPPATRGRGTTTYHNPPRLGESVIRGFRESEAYGLDSGVRHPLLAEPYHTERSMRLRTGSIWYRLESGSRSLELIVMARPRHLIFDEIFLYAFAYPRPNGGHWFILSDMPMPGHPRHGLITPDYRESGPEDLEAEEFTIEAAMDVMEDRAPQTGDLMLGIPNPPPPYDHDQPPQYLVIPPAPRPNSTVGSGPMDVDPHPVQSPPQRISPHSPPPRAASDPPARPRSRLGRPRRGSSSHRASSSSPLRRPAPIYTPSPPATNIESSRASSLERPSEVRLDSPPRAPSPIPERSRPRAPPAAQEERRRNREEGRRERRPRMDSYRPARRMDEPPPDDAAFFAARESDWGLPDQSDSPSSQGISSRPSRGASSSSSVTDAHLNRNYHPTRRLDERSSHRDSRPSPRRLVDRIHNRYADRRSGPANRTEHDFSRRSLRERLDTSTITARPDPHQPPRIPLLFRLEQPSLPDPIDDPGPQEERMRQLDRSDSHRNANTNFPPLLPGGPPPSVNLIRDVIEAIRRNNLPDDEYPSSIFRGSESANVRAARQGLNLHLRVIHGRLSQVFLNVPPIPAALTRPHHNNNQEDYVRSMFIAAHAWILDVRYRLTAAMLSSTLPGFTFELYSILHSELNAERLISRLWSPYREVMALWLVQRLSARDGP
jgi:hypothetical protein